MGPRRAADGRPRRAPAPDNPDVAAPVPDELSGKPIRDAARIVLEDLGGADYSEIARHALARGYRSHKSGDDVAKITRSFYETMRKNPADFVQAGAVFRLRSGDSEPPGDDPAEAGIPRPAELAAAPPAAPTAEEPPSDGPADSPGPDPVASPGPPAEGYAASIDWGDGLRSPGVIVAEAAGVLTVRGMHTYARAGAYSLLFEIRPPG